MVSFNTFNTIPFQQTTFLPNAELEEAAAQTDATEIGDLGELPTDQVLDVDTGPTVGGVLDDANSDLQDPDGIADDVTSLDNSINPITSNTPTANFTFDPVGKNPSALDVRNNTIGGINQVFGSNFGTSFGFTPDLINVNGIAIPDLGRNPDVIKILGSTTMFVNSLTPLGETSIFPDLSGLTPEERQQQFNAAFLANPYAALFNSTNLSLNPTLNVLVNPIFVRPTAARPIFANPALGRPIFGNPNYGRPILAGAGSFPAYGTSGGYHGMIPQSMQYQGMHPQAMPQQSVPPGYMSNYSFSALTGQSMASLLGPYAGLIGGGGNSNLNAYSQFNQASVLGNQNNALFGARFGAGQQGFGFSHQGVPTSFSAQQNQGFLAQSSPQGNMIAMMNQLKLMFTSLMNHTNTTT